MRRLALLPPAFACLLGAASAQAATYYVSPSGDDANAGTEAAPFKTIQKGAGVLQPGDTLLVRAGTYEEELLNDIPAGTSWSEPVTVAAYPGDKPIIKPPPGSDRVLTFAAASSSYIVVEGFVLDATNTTVDAIKITYGSADGASHHIRIKSSEVFGSPGQGILVTGDPAQKGLDVTGNEFIDLDVHDNGTTDFDHGFYVSSAGNLIEGCRVHRNAGWGIHIYNGNADNADDNVIRNNWSYDNARIGDRGVGIGIYSGSGTLAYNNLIWGNKLGVALNYGATGAGVYNNVVYDNLEAGISVGDTASGSLVKNNAVWQNGAGISDTGSGTELAANLVDSDPGFIDAANHDFRPTATSALVDQGVTVAEVTTDIDGVARPQGAAYDIGAYELCEGATCAPDAGGAAGTSGASGSGGVPASGGAPDGGPSAGASGAASSGGGGDDGGCGCRTAQGRGSWTALFVALAAAWIARRTFRLSDPK